jgi:hypothetical protein
LPHEAVVDQDVMPRLQHVADHRRSNRQVAVLATLLCAHRDVLTVAQHDRLRQLTDPQLRPLEIGDQRNRPTRLHLHGSHATSTLGVILVRAMREIESRSVHARVNERAQLFRRVGRRSEGGDDLRATFGDHKTQGSSVSVTLW